MAITCVIRSGCLGGSCCTHILKRLDVTNVERLRGEFGVYTALRGGAVPCVIKAVRQKNSLELETRRLSELSDCNFVVNMLATGGPYIILERLRCDVADVIRDPIDGAYAKLLVAGVAHALVYMHERQMWHGDLKKENILVADDGYPKLCDFGGGCTTYTRSPENQQSAKGDMWSLGVVAYEMVYRALPMIYSTELQLSPQWAEDELINRRLADRKFKITYPTVTGKEKRCLVGIVTKLLRRNRRTRCGAKRVLLDLGETFAVEVAQKAYSVGRDYKIKLIKSV